MENTKLTIAQHWQEMQSAIYAASFQPPMQEQLDNSRRIFYIGASAAIHCLMVDAKGKNLQQFLQRVKELVQELHDSTEAGVKWKQ